MGKLKSAFEFGKYYSSFLNYDLIKIYLNQNRNSSGSLVEHLDAAAEWICRAQDAFSDGGVARSFCLVYNTYFRRRGWIASYPETTGYIIPTMFDYAQFKGDQEFFDRAVRMADWECDVQLKSGAVQGGTIEQKPSPAIFNTGQVIFGWLRTYTETGNEKYLNSAVRAGEFLIEAQDADGAWRKSLSDYVSNQIPFYTYNTRTAWALCLLSSYMDNPRFREAGIRNIEATLTQQLGNGWFRNNCLSDPAQPLLHAIAYCIRGILEVGILENNQNYINSAKKAADVLMDKQEHHGFLAGRFNKKWEPTVSWSCLTGDAQISIIWGKLYQFTKEAIYLECMQKINRYLMKCQILKTDNTDLKGGMPGSNPISGDYGKFEILNWAVKFFIDALMLEVSIQGSNK